MWAWPAALGLLSLEPIPLEQSVSVAPGPCLEAVALAESTASWLGRDTVDGAVRVDVHAVGEDRIAFRLHTGDIVTAERELSPLPTDCADRTAAVGLLIALAIDERVSTAVGLSSPPVASVMPPGRAVAAEDGEAAPKLDARERPEPERRTPLPVAVGVYGVGSYEVLPGAGVGGGVGVSIRVRPRLDVGVDLLAIGGLPFALGEGETQPTLGAVAPSLCPVLARGRLGVRLCLAPVLGLIVARGSGYPRNETIALPWLGARTSADLRIAVTRRVALSLDAGVVAPLVGARFDVRNEGGIVQERRTPAGAGLSGGLGVVVQLRDAQGSG